MVGLSDSKKIRTTSPTLPGLLLIKVKDDSTASCSGNSGTANVVFCMTNYLQQIMKYYKNEMTLDRNKRFPNPGKASIFRLHLIKPITPSIAQADGCISVTPCIAIKGVHTPLHIVAAPLAPSPQNDQFDTALVRMDRLFVSHLSTTEFRAWMMPSGVEWLAPTLTQLLWKGNSTLSNVKCQTANQAQASILPLKYLDI